METTETKPPLGSDARPVRVDHPSCDETNRLWHSTCDRCDERQWGQSSSEVVLAAFAHETVMHGGTTVAS